MPNIFIFFLIFYVELTTSYIKSVSFLPLRTPLSNKLQSNLLTKLSLQTNKNINTNISSIIKTPEYYITQPFKKDGLQNLPCTGDQINITSIYLNIDKVKGVYFSKDVKNIIFTFPDNLSELYYYDVNNNENNGTKYKISNNTRINMKNLKKFVFQSFNNNIDGILF
jgi:hypothetical protein